MANTPAPTEDSVKAASGDQGSGPTRMPPPPGAQAVVEASKPYQPTNLKVKWLVSALVVGVLADQALRRPPWHSVAMTLLLVSAGIGLLVSGFLEQRSAKAMTVASMVFAVMLSVRSDPRLTVFNILASLFLLLAASALARRGSVWDYRPAEMLRDSLAALFFAAETPILAPLEVGSRVRIAKEKGELTNSLAVLRGLLIAVPVVLVLGLLLASADAIFSSFFGGISIPIGPMIGHVVLISAGAAFIAVLIRMAAQETDRDVPEMNFRLGQTEAGVVLGGLVTLFGVFAVAQVVALAGAGESVLAEAGLTFKEYARQGFFQLLWVAGITLVILLTLHVVTESAGRGQKVIRTLQLTAVGLTGLIVAVAFGRLILYIGDDGLTPLRFYSAAFSVWVGVAFLVVAARLCDLRPGSSWLMPALVTSGLVALIVLNISNPEAVIAHNNINRDVGAMTAHMEKLSGDGLSVIADNIDDLNPELRGIVVEQLCTRYEKSRGGNLGLDKSPGFLDWNLGTSRGRSALASIC